MLVWVTLAAGFAVIVLGSLAVMRVDHRWRSAHMQCCRCLSTWHSHAKICERCGGRGQTYDWLAARFAGFPTHDWQGYLDTGPIPVIGTDARFPEIDLPAPRSAAAPTARVPDVGALIRDPGGALTTADPP